MDYIYEEFKHITKTDPNFSEKCEKLISEIKAEKITILQIVEFLGPFLTHELPIERELGILILNLILDGLPTNCLNEKELDTICLFYSNRLKDHHQVIPAALEGIKQLYKQHHVRDGYTIPLLGSLFEHISCQQQQQCDRMNIYKIFELTLEKHSSELSTMGINFVYGIISSIEGERDPNNLVFLFNWIPKFVKSVKLSHLTEEMFDVLACYFPIDFKSPPQESHHITREDLAESLCSCLCAVPEFGELALTLALEKLNTSLTIAKLDSLKLVINGCENFEVSTYEQHSTELWSSMNKGLLNSRSSEIGETYIAALKAVTTKMSPSSTFIAMLTDIFDTLRGNIIPDSKLIEPSCKILLHIASTSKPAAEFMAKHVLPILFNTIKINTNPVMIPLLLEITTHFEYHNFRYNDISIKMISEMEDLVQLCTKAICCDNQKICCTAFDCLSTNVEFYTTDIRQSLYPHIKRFIYIQQPDVRKAMLRFFEKMGKQWNVEILHNVLTTERSSNQIPSLDLYLEAISVLSTNNYFEDFVFNTISEYVMDDEIEHTDMALTNLEKMLLNDETVKFTQQNLLDRNFTGKLLGWVMNKSEVLNINQHKDCMLKITSVLKILIGSQSVELQENILVNELPKITNVCKLSNPVMFALLLDGILTRIHREISVDHIYFTFLSEAGLSIPDETISLCCAQLFSNLVNKCSNEQLLNDILANIDTSLTDFFDGKQNYSITNILSLMIWIIKALVMRNHTHANFWIQKLFLYLDKHPIVARGFGIIADDSYDCLGVKSFANRSVLYRQKYFSQISDKLCEVSNSLDNHQVSAFSSLLQQTPHNIILLQFKKILKLFLICFDHHSNSHGIYILLNILRNFSMNKESIVEEYIQEFLPRLLKLSSSTSSMKIRIEAIKCIQNYTKGYELHKLLPFKKDVIAGLAVGINDEKRLVRKEAVEARNMWFLLDAPI